MKTYCEGANCKKRNTCAKHHMMPDKWYEYIDWSKHGGGSYWQDSEGNLWAIPPKKEVDYFITATNCTKLDDGYYYYNGSCAPNATFPILVGLAANAKPPVGYTLHVQILAEGIQCVPDTAVQEAWGATYNGTTWSKDN